MGRFVLLCAFILLTASFGFAQGTKRPEPTSAPIPAYPAFARAKRIHGVVLVDVQVDKEGKVVEAVALMGGEYLRDAATKAALGWRFKPLEEASSSYSIRLTFIFHEFGYKPPQKKPDFRSPYQIEILYPEAAVDCFNNCR